MKYLLHVAGDEVDWNHGVRNVVDAMNDLLPPGHKTERKEVENIKADLK